MKKITILICSILALLFLFGCGNSLENNEADTGTENDNSSDLIEDSNKNQEPEEKSLGELLCEELEKSKLIIRDEEVGFFATTNTSDFNVDKDKMGSLLSLTSSNNDLSKFIPIAYSYDAESTFINSVFWYEITFTDSLVEKKIDFEQLNLYEVEVFAGHHTNEKKDTDIESLDIWFEKGLDTFESGLKITEQIPDNILYLVEVVFSLSENEEKSYGAIQFAIKSPNLYCKEEFQGKETIGKDTALQIVQTHFFGSLYEKYKLGEGWTYVPKFIYDRNAKRNHWLISMECTSYTENPADIGQENYIIYTIDKYSGEIVKIDTK